MNEGVGGVGGGVLEEKVDKVQRCFEACGQHK